MTEVLPSGSILKEFSYDDFGQLIQTKIDGSVVAQYSHDTNGNILDKNGRVGTFDDQDRLTDFDGNSISYNGNGDVAGMMLNGQNSTLNYDVFGNLKTVGMGAKTISYLDDPLNRRIGKKVNGALVQGFIYQDQLNPVAELDGSGNVLSIFIYASKPHVPDYMVKNGVNYKIITDHLGSPRLVVNASTGTIVQAMNYSDFGEVITDTNPGFQPFGFAGGLYDLETGLVKFGARDYNPTTGRWMQKDPIGFGGGDTNLYRYVNNDPINYIDPMGYWGIYAGGKVQGVVGVGPGAGAVGGVRIYYGSEGNGTASGVLGAITIPGTVIGGSFGRGFEAGFFFLDTSAFKNAVEHSIDTPWGGFSIFTNDGFFSGFGFGGPSVGASYTRIAPHEQPDFTFDYSHQFGGQACMAK